MFEIIYTILTRLETANDVIGSWEPSEGSTHFDVTLNDFEGFDENWNEIFRDYADAEMVEALFEALATAERVDENYYITYYFADCSLTLGYSSYDI